MFPAPFVNAAGFATQLALACAARFVTPVTVTVQLAVPLLIVTPVNAIVSGAPTVTTLDPEHPAPNVTVGVADVNRRLAGSASVNAIPACSGFVPVFVSVNTSVVDPVSAIEAAPNALLKEAWVTVSVWLVTPFSIPEIAVTWAAPFTYEPAVLDVTFTVIVQLEAPRAALTPVPPTVIVPRPASP